MITIDEGAEVQERGPKPTFKLDINNAKSDLYDDLEFEDEAQTNLASYRSGAEGKDFAGGKNIKTGKIKKITKLELPGPATGAVPE